jgi:MGT family glycosyltransferase
MSFKIFVHSLPASGHVNPMSGVVERLVKEYKAKVYWYSTEQFKTIIENTGAEFRELNGWTDDPKSMPNLPPNKRSFPLLTFLNLLLRVAEANLQNLTDDIEQDKPDLILSDSMALHFKWAWRLYIKRQKERQVKHKKNDDETSEHIPQVVFLETSFAQQANVFPNKQEEEIMFSLSASEKFLNFFRITYAVILYRIKTLQYGLEYKFPINDIFNVDPLALRLVTTFPEFQPRSHLLGKNTKFIGCCIDDKIRPKIENSILDEILAKFPECNPNTKPSSSEKLIYISMGTIFNKNVPLYTKFIRAISAIEPTATNKFKLNDLTFVISCGNSYSELKEYEENGKLNVPPNVLLLPKVPQLEILKRASLFVTHCGMNSTNESIYYAVPMVNVPLSADQPLVAHRAANELGFGVYVDFINMKEETFKNALLQVLNDDSYHERIYRFSQLSRQSNGKITSANYIIEHLKKGKIN